MRYRLALLLAAVLAGLAAACSEDGDPVIGFDLAPGILDSTGVREASIPASALDTFFQTTRNSSDVVWAGSEPEVASSAEAKAFLRFPALDIPVAAIVVGASLILNADAGGDYGDRGGQTLEIQRVTAASWFTDTSQGWPFDIHVPTSPPAVFEVAECDTPNVRIATAVPPNLVADWAARPDSNYGMVLVARGAGSWKRFRATRTVVGAGTGNPYTLEAPALEVRYTVDGEPDTLRLSMREHTTLYSVSPAVEGRTGTEPAALIGGPYDFRAVVSFDLDPVSDDANLNRLRMKLRIDPGAVFLGQADSSVTIGAHEIITLPGENLDRLPAVGFTTLPFARVTVKAGADTTIVLDVSLLGPRVEKGVLLKVEQEFPSLVRLGFVTREGAAAGHPTLDVVYTLPPRIRL